ncbi:MAG: class I SAM-dependent methyltransferase [Methanobrevibacter sp.]|nr:class I SAM-dependent methyltransferase [Methanobrevibacter sp.]
MGFKDKILSQSDQFNFYKENYEALLHENEILRQENNILKQTQSDKYMFKKKIRGSSGDVGKTVFLDWVLNNVGRSEKILDVGFGGGVYGKILKAFYYENIDGVDVWPENIDEMGLNFIYDNIFIENVLDFEFERYDLIIMGDVLEHMSLEDSKVLLNKFINGKTSKLFIQVPYMYENHHEWQGNPYEVHIQDEIDEEYMKREFPFLELLQIDTVPAEMTVIGRETGEDTYCATYVWFED